jgi:uncharacterized protein YcfJ
MEENMKFRLLIAACMLTLAATPALAQAPYGDRYDQRYDERYAPPPPTVAENVTFGYADVLRVDPVYEYVRNSQPREECYDERVVQREPRGGDPTGGTVLGAIIGGALGNQVGKGDGRKAATIAGAVIGGAVGRNVDRNNGPGREYETTERRCRVVDGGYEHREVVGYDVEYRYRGEVYLSRLGYNPGDRLRVRVAVSPVE